MKQKNKLTQETNDDFLSKDSSEFFDKEIDKISNVCKTLINKTEVVSSSQVNNSASVGDFLDEDKFASAVEFVSKKCKEMIQSKTTPVSTNLY